MLASDAKGDAVGILAIWFGVAVVVGLLLGYAARRLKRGPKGQPSVRRADNANAPQGVRDDDTSSGQPTVKPTRCFRKRTRN